MVTLCSGCVASVAGCKFVYNIWGLGKKGIYPFLPESFLSDKCMSVGLEWAVLERHGNKDELSGSSRIYRGDTKKTGK